jgi:hypothetical protein
MWGPRRLTTLWASTDCYRDSFTYSTVVTVLNEVPRHEDVLGKWSRSSTCSKFRPQQLKPCGRARLNAVKRKISCTFRESFWYICLSRGRCIVTAVHALIHKFFIITSARTPDPHLIHLNVLTASVTKDHRLTRN